MTLHPLLGTELPVIQAPMAGVQSSAMAIVVSTAGGLGSLPCALLSPQAMRAELAAIAAATTRPVNVNFFCHHPPAADQERERAWRDRLQPFYRELGVDPDQPVAAPARAPFNDEAAELLAAFKPAIVSFHFGLPAPPLVARVRACGAKILSSATTVDEAKWLEAQGVDGVIAQGYEAGGHRGMFLTGQLTTQVGTFALLPQLVKAVRVPVIAAGGIAGAAGVAAALALGASAVQVGTAFLLCPEATTSDIHRAALSTDAARHTAITNVFTGRPARGIVNRLIREVGPMAEEAPAFPLAAAAVTPLRMAAEARGSSDFSPLWAGQNVSECTSQGAAALVRQLAGVD